MTLGSGPGRLRLAAALTEYLGGDIHGDDANPCPIRTSTASPSRSRSWDGCRG